MTESEVIKELHKIRPRGGIIPQKRAEAIDAAINALEEIEQYKALGTVDELRLAKEKQIPKKVNLRHIRKYDGFDDGECPNCGMSVSRDCDGDDVFCPDCGQKLDWSDKE